jgi:hypothetical protein
MSKESRPLDTLSFDCQLAYDIQWQMMKRRWKVKSRFSQNKRSLYITAVKGWRRIVVRVSDHKPRAKDDLTMSFHPRSSSTIEDLCRLLD